MITILVVGEFAPAVAEAAAGRASVEVLVSRDAEDALEKLARNRRIDAVLIAGAADPAEIIGEIREEDPAAPPVYAERSAGSVEGVVTLQASSPEELIGELIALLSA